MLATRTFPAPTRTPQIPQPAGITGCDTRIFPGWGPRI